MGRQEFMICKIFFFFSTLIFFIYAWKKIRNLPPGSENIAITNSPNNRCLFILWYFISKKIITIN